MSPRHVSNDEKKLLGCTWALAGLLLAIAALVFAISFMVRTCRGSGGAAAAGSGEIGHFPDGIAGGDTKNGLSLEELKLTSVPLTGYWKEEDTFIPDELSWTGSTCVVGKDEEFLYLLTNRHCLGLNELFTADSDGSEPEILDYRLSLHFPENVIKTVSKITIIRDDVDLAWLKVPLGGLREGVHYVTLLSNMANSDFPRTVGADVVAVGAPLGYAGTHTFGRISNVMSWEIGAGRYLPIIQTDAAINHGNSGGPLLVKQGNRYLCVGINTWRRDDGESLGFAIDCAYFDREVTTATYNTTPSGLRDLYRSVSHDR